MIDSNRLRVSGLASGIDVDSIVQKLMKAEQIPLNKLKQQQQTLEWQRDDYRSMNSLLLDLKNTAFDLSLQASFSYKTASSSDESLVTATADGSSGNASYTLSDVTSLATAANNNSTAAIAKNTSFDPDLSIYDMKDNFTYSPTTSFDSTSTPAGGDQISVNSDGTTFNLTHGLIDTTTSISVDGANYDVYTTQADYDSSSSTNKVLLDTDTGKLTFNNTLKKGSTISAVYTHKTVSFSITTYDDSGTGTPHDFTFDATKSLNDILSSVSKSDAGVTMFYDSYSQKVSITRSETGDFHSGGAEIGFTGSFLTSTLDLHEANESGGTDVAFTLNGLQTHRHSNNFTIDGVSFSLKGTFTNPVTITTDTDTDKIFDKIKSFVDKYNDTIKKINDELGEKRYRDYPPLTDDQKKDMSENDIKLWNEKAQSGMLASDTIFPGSLSQMRVDLYSKVSGVSNSDYSQLAEIGITTSSDYRDHGKLVIDEEKLRSAIASHPKSVMELFTATGTDYSHQGIAERLQSTVEDTISRVEDEAGNTDMTYVQYYLGRSLNNLDERISTYEGHLSEVQDRYYKEFTAMEQAIQKANQQSGYLANAFS